MIRVDLNRRCFRSTHGQQRAPHAQWFRHHRRGNVVRRQVGGRPRLANAPNGAVGATLYAQSARLSGAREPERDTSALPNNQEVASGLFRVAVVRQLPVNKSAASGLIQVAVVRQHPVNKSAASGLFRVAVVR
jgi:hypothetical protein